MHWTAIQPETGAGGCEAQNGTGPLKASAQGVDRIGTVAEIAEGTPLHKLFSRNTAQPQ